MKTAISVPDPVFAEVEAKVGELGMSRSQFYTVAAESYLQELSHQNLIAQINEAVDLETRASRHETEQFTAAAVRSSQSRLGNESW